MINKRKSKDTITPTKAEIHIKNHD